METIRARLCGAIETNSVDNIFHIVQETKSDPSHWKCFSAESG